MDAPEGSKNSRSEELRFESVVAVNPGVYDVALVGSDGKTKAKNTLVALNRESFIVLRTGVEAKQGPSYPQELVVYPKLDPSDHRTHRSSWCTPSWTHQSCTVQL